MFLCCRGLGNLKCCWGLCVRPRGEIACEVSPTGVVKPVERVRPAAKFAEVLQQLGSVEELVPGREKGHWSCLARLKRELSKCRV